MPDPIDTTPAAPAVAAPAAPAAPADPAAPVAPDPAPTPVAAPAPPKLGKEYAKLAQQQRAAREAGEKLKAERMAFEAQQAEYQAFQAAKAEAKRNPLKFLEAMGLTYQDVTESQLNEGQPTANLEAKAVKDELAAFRKQIEAEKQQAVEAQKAQLQAAEQQVLGKFQQDIAEFIKAGGEKYELTNHFGHASLVFQVINDHHAAQQNQGTPPDQIRLLSIEEAADAVEKHLEGQAQQFTALKKFPAKAAAPVAAPPAKPAPKSKEQPTRSVTNALSPASPTKPASLTMAEREKRALETLRRGRQP